MSNDNVTVNSVLCSFTWIRCRLGASLAGAAGMFLRVFCQIAAALQEQGEAAMAPGAIWSQAVSQFNGEQLAYIAALATGAQLLCGDRPKEITYRCVSHWLAGLVPDLGRHVVYEVLS